MVFVKCPRCELNYILDGGQYCKVCRREMKGDVPRDEPELCSVCNAAPVIPGKDVCLFCYKEMGGAVQEDPDINSPVGEASISIDPVSTMEEIIPAMDEDIPAHEYNEIENDLSLDMMEEEESKDNEDDKDKEKEGYDA